MPSIQVSIIESPSAMDILNNVHEGNTLCTALKHANVDAALFTVVSNEVWPEALRRVKKRMVEQRAFGAWPVLHLSMHGNYDGVALTDGFMPWSSLRAWLALLNLAVDGNMLVCMSTCNGFGGFTMAEDDGPAAFLGIVGPKREVKWKDTVGGFVAFYHHLQTKDGGWDPATKLMNAVVGGDVFGSVSFEDARNFFQELRLREQLSAQEVTKGVQQLEAAHPELAGSDLVKEVQQR